MTITIDKIIRKRFKYVYFPKLFLYIQYYSNKTHISLY